MIIERWLSKKQLIRYRRWKRKVRDQIGLIIEMIRLAMHDGGFQRLFDRGYYPVFVCGVSGSGTTLLAGLLDQDFQTELFLNESDRMTVASRLLWVDKAYTYEEIADFYEDLYLPGWMLAPIVGYAKLNLYRRLSSYPRSSGVVVDKSSNVNQVRIKKLKKAFPKSTIVLIYRDPGQTIEGLKRKWEKPFGTASVDGLCEYWNRLHQDFLDQAKDFIDEVVIVSYQQLVDNPQAVMNEIATRANLASRTTKKALPDQENKPGKGLRSIVSGEIVIVKDAFSQVKPVLSSDEMEYVSTQTAAVNSRLEALSIKA